MQAAANSVVRPPLSVAFGCRRKREGRDAAGLADLLLMGRLREAWIAPWEIHKLTCEITLVNTAIALSYGLVWTAGILLRIRRLEVRIPPSAPLPPSHDNAIGRDEGLAPTTA
jgi:hypothetical protein